MAKHHLPLQALPFPHHGDDAGLCPEQKGIETMTPGYAQTMGGRSMTAAKHKKTLPAEMGKLKNG
ncbi:hypothetical protein ACFFP0_25390 [Rhizobium puerariae]|uniref:Uncharacterized protein n=1 Tax=Rhizobium puerariae TaxID=1585791 RepID=A0ABV6AQP2_9HYPH